MQQTETAAPARKQVYVVHGCTANPEDHWFPWLKAQLEAGGVDVEVLAMPDSDQPVAAAWDAYLDARVVRRDRDTFLVGHSLGCIAIVRHLLQTQGGAYGGMVLVAGFAEHLPHAPGPTGPDQSTLRPRRLSAARTPRP